MLITLVQRIVSAFDKNFSPLNERGREKSQNRAKNHLLEESSVQPLFQQQRQCQPCHSLPKTPLFGLHDPEAEEQVGEGMRQDARRKPFRTVSNAVVKSAGQ